MINLILFGPPGSGKGTQSDLLIKRFGFLHLSTGDLLRDEISRQTPLGVEAKKFMDNGQLVPDEVVIGMIDSKLNDNQDSKGIIFDGFPRTVAQAEALDKLLDLRNSKINILLSLEVPEEELKKRLIQRGAQSGRSDDNEEIIIKRIAEYKNKTEAVAKYYDQQDKLVRIKGIGSIESISESLTNAITALV